MTLLGKNTISQSMIDAVNSVMGETTKEVVTVPEVQQLDESKINWVKQPKQDFKAGPHWQQTSNKDHGGILCH